MFQSSKNREAIVVAGLVTTILAIMALVNNFAGPEVDVISSMIGIGLSFIVFIVATIYRMRIWSVIGSYVTGVILLLIVLLEWFNLGGLAVPSLILGFVALPFLVTWWFNKEQWGWLIPAYVLFAIIPVLYFSENTVYEDNLVPAYVLGAVGLPFILTALYSGKNGFYVPGIILWLFAAGFFAVQAGLPAEWLTIGLPVIGIVIGVALLLWAFTVQSDRRQQE